MNVKLVESAQARRERDHDSRSAVFSQSNLIFYIPDRTDPRILCLSDSDVSRQLSLGSRDPTGPDDRFPTRKYPPEIALQLLPPSQHRPARAGGSRQDRLSRFLAARPSRVGRWHRHHISECLAINRRSLQGDKVNPLDPPGRANMSGHRHSSQSTHIASSCNIFHQYPPGPTTNFFASHSSEARDTNLSIPLPSRHHIMRAYLSHRFPLVRTSLCAIPCDRYLRPKRWSVLTRHETLLRGPPIHSWVLLCFSSVTLKVERRGLNLGIPMMDVGLSTVVGPISLNVTTKRSPKSIYSFMGRQEKIYCRQGCWCVQ